MKITPPAKKLFDLYRGVYRKLNSPQDNLDYFNDFMDDIERSTKESTLFNVNLIKNNLKDKDRDMFFTVHGAIRIMKHIDNGWTVYRKHYSVLLYEFKTISEEYREQKDTIEKLRKENESLKSTSIFKRIHAFIFGT